MREGPLVPDAQQTPPRWSHCWGPWLIVPALGALTVVLMRLEGRRWWCAGGEAFLWTSDVWSRHNSQHLGDPYSFTHVSHGLIFFGLLTIIPFSNRWPISWRLCVATAGEALWEVLENTPWVIERYRETTMALGYEGDSIANALGDIGCFILGFALAARLGFRWSLALFVTMEVVLVMTIRDNLALNVLMLLWPVEAIKVWQTAGQGM